MMATNGYTDLEAGPEAGWMGHYSLDKAGNLFVSIYLVEILLFLRREDWRLGLL